MKIYEINDKYSSESDVSSITYHGSLNHVTLYLKEKANIEAERGRGLSTYLSTVVVSEITISEGLLELNAIDLVTILMNRSPTIERRRRKISNKIFIIDDYNTINSYIGEKMVLNKNIGMPKYQGCICKVTGISYNGKFEVHLEKENRTLAASPDALIHYREDEFIHNSTDKSKRAEVKAIQKIREHFRKHDLLQVTEKEIQEAYHVAVDVWDWDNANDREFIDSPLDNLTRIFIPLITGFTTTLLQSDELHDADYEFYKFIIAKLNIK